MKTKSRNLIVVFLMVFAFICGVFAITPLTANAASGTGTENDPVYVTNYAELKEALERDDNTWIVVNEFNNGNYYTLISGDDYSQTSLDDSAYGCGAINIPTERNKHLTINTTIDCRTASTQQGSLLYCFINNRGNLTIDGNGTLAVSFNAGNYANAIILNQGNLTIDAPITLDATCKSVQSYGRAIMNHSGTFTISDGTYIGFKSNTLGTLGNVGALWQASENANKESIISGGQFQLKDENGIVSNNYALVNSGVDNLTLKGGTFYGIYASQYNVKLPDLLGSGCKYTRNGLDYSVSGLTCTNLKLTVVNTNLIKTINLSVQSPVDGDLPSAPTTSTDNTSIYAYEWYDGDSMMSNSFDTFDGGKTYRMQVGINATGTKEFSKNTVVLINGQQATVKSYDSDYVLCYCNFEAKNQVIENVQVGLDTPFAGQEVGEPYSYTNSVDITSYEWYPNVTHYQGGHTFKVTFRIAPKDGFEFSNNLNVIVNGQKANIENIGTDFAICSMSFAIEKNITVINNIAITVEQPVAGGTPAIPTENDDRFEISAYEWSPNVKFEASEQYTLLIMIKQNDINKTFLGSNSITINGENAKINNVSQSTILISYTFTVPMPKYTVSFNANGGTGTMENETEQYGDYIMPDCGFTAPNGKNFVAWAVNGVDGEQFASGTTYDVNDNVTFYAIWEDYAFTKQPISQAKSVDGDDKTISPDWNVNFTATKYDIIENGSIYTTVTKKWFEISEENATSRTFKVRAYYDETNYIESEEFTLTWTTNVRQVIYQGGDAGGNTLIYEYVNGDIIKFLENEEYTYNGHIFDYWSIRILGDNFTEVAKKYPNDTYELTQDIIAVATWKAKEISSLTAEYNGNSIYAGNTLDTSLIVIKLNYNDGSFDTLDLNQVGIYIGNNNITNLAEYKFETVGTAEIKITSEEQETTMPIVVDGYTVSFNANEGTGIMSAMSNQYGNVVLPETATFEAPKGKQFLKWALGSANGTQFDGGTQYEVKTDVTFYAVWTDKTPQSLFATYGADIVVGNKIDTEKIKITLTYTNESTEELGAGQVSYWADEQTQITNPVDYVFNQIGQITVIVKYSNVQTTMKITVIGYTVSFNANGGSGNMLSVFNQYGEYTIPTICEFTAPIGKQFKGWATTANGEVINGTYNVTADVELFAIWEAVATGITATYNGTIVAGNKITPSNIAINLVYSDTTTKPVNAGNVEYWYKGSQIQHPVDYVFEVELIGYVDITVKYQGFETVMEIEVVGYEITFNANGGTGDMQPVEYVGAYTLPNCTFTAPDGKQFKGWALASDGEVIDGPTYNVTADVELFAIWEDIPVVKFDVTFNANGGTGTMQAIEFAGTYSLPTCTFTAPDGKKFKGWATTANGEVIDGTTYNVTADVELYAIWEDIPVVNYTITFNANGGTGTMQAVEYVGEYTLPNCTFTAPDGKQFKGWALASDGEVIDGTYNVTANIELYAIWENIPAHEHNHGTAWESDANNHWNECSCGDKANVGAHSDGNADGKCDTCDYQMGNGGGAAETPDTPKDGLSGGAIAGIVVGSVAVAGLGGFALVWFVIKKKTWAEFLAIFKKK